MESVGNPHRFQVQYHDVETGLHYNLARYYSVLMITLLAY
nr:hypothetical protein [Vibrio vulnificus]